MGVHIYRRQVWCTYLHASRNPDPSLVRLGPFPLSYYSIAPFAHAVFI
jgi:hypothetical protein